VAEFHIYSFNGGLARSVPVWCRFGHFGKEIHLMSFFQNRSGSGRAPPTAGFPQRMWRSAETPATPARFQRASDDMTMDARNV